MKKYLFIVGLLFPFILSAQKLKGKVTDSKKEPLFGASVLWLNSNVGVTTENNGTFTIDKNDQENKTLIIRYLGYFADTININSQNYIEVKLKEMNALKEVTIT
jgi:hypothetical protein